MRNLKRIYRILRLIQAYWQEHSDERFGQALINMGICPDNNVLWHLEDDELEAALKMKYLTRNKIKK